MKYKYNFAVLKNQSIGFEIKINNKIYIYKGILKEVKIEKNYFQFIFDKNILSIEKDLFLHFKLYESNSSYIFGNLDEKTINCLIGFTMFDTFGFPIELTKEILEEDGYFLDINGFNILKKLNREKSRNNSSLKTAFN